MKHYETRTARLLEQLWDCLPHVVHETAETVVLAIFGVALLNAIYGFFRSEWPESYTSLDNRIEHQYRSNPVRTIVGFRGLPVGLTVMLISEMMDRAEGDTIVGTTGMIACYLLLTSGRAIHDVLKKPRHPNFKFIVLHHFGQTLIVVLFAWFGLIGHDLWGSWIPRGEEFAIAVLAGAFASVMAIWARSWLAAVKMPFPELVQELKDDIGVDQLNYAFIRSGNIDRSGNLGCLVQAILLAEAQQRPAWFRKLETFIGKLGRPGTFGVAQVSSDRPISDEQSIDLLIQQLTAGAGFEFQDMDLHSGEVRDLLKDHNPDQEHVERILTYFYDLRSYGLSPYPDEHR